MAKLVRLLLYGRPYAPAFLGLSVIAILLSLASVLQPWPLKVLVDSVIGEAALPAPLRQMFDAAGITASPRALLVFSVAFGLLLFAITSALDVVSTWGWTVVGRRMSYDLAQDLFAKLQRRSLAYHSRTTVGEAITRVSADSYSVHKLFITLVFHPAN